MRQKLTFFWILLFALGCRGAEPASARPPRRPPVNILFIVADDMRWDAMGCAGNKIIQTPNIDQLARTGVRFKNHFCTTAICCVSRASMFSGQWERRHGIDDFAKTFSPAAWSKTYPAVLRNHGYRTGFIGKFGVGNEMPEREFDYWRGFPGQGKYLGHEKHLTALMGDQALEFLNSVSNRQPFCLSISFKSPHAQDEAPQRPFPPDPRDENLYGDVEIPRPETAAPEYFADLPGFIQTSEGRTRWLPRFSTDALFQQTARDYYRLITGMDREIGRIMSRLEELKMDRDTLVIFTSDNGFFLGEHGLADKWFMYEESIRLPLIIRLPRRAHAGQAVETTTLNVDMAPTMLDFARVPIPPEMQGRSLRRAITGRFKEREEWFYEHHFTAGGRIPPCEGIRTKRWKYIRYTGVDPAVEELYDLKKDPMEKHNLAQDLTYVKTLVQLRFSWIVSKERRGK